MDGTMDPAVSKGLARAIGHPAPFTREEMGSIDRVQIRRAKSISGVHVCDSLRTIILAGCDSINLGELSGLKDLDTLFVSDSAVRELTPIEPLQLATCNIPRNMITDLTPLLNIPRLVFVNVIGNPLSQLSYEEVIPQLKGRGIEVEMSGELEWRITTRLHRSGVPISCYKAPDSYRLCRPGFALTPFPDYDHAAISEDDARSLLDRDPEDAHRFFEDKAD